MLQAWRAYSLFCYSFYSLQHVDQIHHQGKEKPEKMRKKVREPNRNREVSMKRLTNTNTMRKSNKSNEFIDIHCEIKCRLSALGFDAIQKKNRHFNISTMLWMRCTNMRAFMYI